MEECSIEGRPGLSRAQPCRQLDSPVWASGREVLAGEKHLGDVSLCTEFKTRAQVGWEEKGGRASFVGRAGREPSLGRGVLAKARGNPGLRTFQSGRNQANIVKQLSFS